MKKIYLLLMLMLPVFIQAQTDSTSQNTDEGIFEVVEEQPSYPGGETARMEFIKANLVYPDSAYKNGVEGKIFVQFVVEADGSVTNVKAVRSFDESCANEAVRVVKLMRWNPAKQRGKAVRVKISMPIAFKIN